MSEKNKLVALNKIAIAIATILTLILWVDTIENSQPISQVLGDRFQISSLI